MTPVLVTGLPRSGTSWAGKMLAASGELVYVNEPLNPSHRPGRSPGVLDAEVTHRFQYISADDDATWLRAFTDTVALRYRFLAELRRNRAPYDLARMVRYGTAFTFGRLTGRRALLDDPFALLSAGWFAGRLGCRVIVMVRDPVAFAGSWQRLGWTVYFHELLEQPLLVRDHPRVEELRPLVGSQDRLAKAAALWRVTTAVAADLAARHPEILLVSYEDLATDPLTGFRRLYDWAGLTWTPAAESRISRACTAPASCGRGFAWHGLSRTAFRPTDSRRALAEASSRLTPAEARRVLELAHA
ncbi:sulfotransferase [Planobispora takensis]|uniref:Sulfotransferase family protein n=1 Tax=Planobispora takensis TaxID=1367882 RepID=A0A8J3WR26_9ACTN|nr:sulfotransferase [Planobispora takensis]GIH99093.1 sulfotransferase family protein [Planobispora takensis]